MAALHFVSRHGRPDCVRRLKAVVTSWWGSAAGTPCGRVRDDGATLHMAIGYRNSFQTVLRLRLADRPDGGTDLTCLFGMNHFVLAFITFWLAGVAGIDLVLAARSLFAGERIDIANLIVPLLMAGFGAALVGVGRYTARNEQSQLLLFLESTLDARPVG